MSSSEKFGQHYFEKKCNDKHGDRFDYSLAEYKRSNIKVKIICREHGVFEQTPSEHWSGLGGCKGCKSKLLRASKLSTHDKFVKKASVIHENNCEYIGQYIDQFTPIEVKCLKHSNIFTITPKVHLRGSTNCSVCVSIKFQVAKSRTSGNFIEDARKVHNNKYTYNISHLEFVPLSVVVQVICSEHGQFDISAGKHLQGQGCVPCSIIRTADILRKNTDYFISKSREVHGDRYDYSKSVYKGAQEYVEIICPIHGSFQMWPNNHYSGNGCRPCSMAGFSKICIRWLNFESRSRCVHIQHAGNSDKEYSIPGTPFRVDGYSETCEIFEFYGDYYHGNPRKYCSEVVNELQKKTMGELLTKTLKREKKLRDMGYTVIIMWEDTWRLVEKVAKKWKALLKT